MFHRLSGWRSLNAPSGQDGKTKNKYTAPPRDSGADGSRGSGVWVKGVRIPGQDLIAMPPGPVPCFASRDVTSSLDQCAWTRYRGDFTPPLPLSHENTRKMALVGNISPISALSETPGRSLIPGDPVPVFSGCFLRAGSGAQPRPLPCGLVYPGESGSLSCRAISHAIFASAGVIMPGISPAIVPIAGSVLGNVVICQSG